MNTKIAVLAMALVCGLSATSVLAKAHVDADHMRHDNVSVAKGETVSDDVVTSGNITVAGVVKGDCVSMGGNITAPGEINGDVVAMGGNTILSGVARGGLTAVGGSVTLTGRVDGDLSAVGGDVKLGKGAVISGDVSVVGGHLEKEGGAVVKGSISEVGLGALKKIIPSLTRGGLKLALASGMHEVDDQAEASEHSSLWLKVIAFVSFIAGIGFLLGVVGFFLPNEIKTIASAIHQDFWRSLGVGTLAVVLILPSFLLLTVSILGIPLIPLAVLGWCVAALMAVAGFGYMVAERTAQWLDKTTPAAPLASASGWFAIKGLSLAGILLGGFVGGTLLLTGWLLLTCGMVAGLGAVWNTRMGRRSL